MSKVRGLYRRKGETEWIYDFVIGGHRFCGTTGCRARRDAEKKVTEIRDAKRAEIKAGDPERPMSFGDAASRWWQERGQHRKDARTIKWVLRWLQVNIGKTKPIIAIDDDQIASLITRRRAEGVKTSTVNRSVTEPLRAILTRAAEVWGRPVAKVGWKGHLLPEAQERVREASPDEEAKLFAAMRPDFIPVMRFLLLTGLRRAEACNLLWDDVRLDIAEMTVRGKGDRIDVLPLTPSALAVLSTEIGKHPTRVFSYVVRHPWGGERGERVAILPDTLGTAYWRARKKSGVKDFRLHDLRHTAATRFLRHSGNMALAQKMLRHARVTTTARYAHVTKEDLRAAMTAAFPVKSPAEIPAEPKFGDFLEGEKELKYKKI